MSMRREASGVVAGEVVNVTHEQTKFGEVWTATVRTTEPGYKWTNDVMVRGWGEEARDLRTLLVGEEVVVYCRIQRRPPQDPAKWRPNDLRVVSVERQGELAPAAEAAPEPEPAAAADDEEMPF